MAENSKIEWTDHTFNPWIGCTKVSPACDHCYAEAWDARFKGHRWGPHALRTKTSTANWRKPLKWNREAEERGIRYRVFCASLADVFDNHPSIDPQWRLDLWELIAETPNLDWLLLTKRPQNIVRFLPDEWGSGEWGEPWSNVWLGTTVENQTEADRRIPHLMATPAAVRFLSCEPLLGPVDLTRIAISHPSDPRTHVSVCFDRRRAIRDAMRGPAALNWYQADASIMYPIDWVICGGESGPGARPMHPDWARKIRDDCAAAGVPFFFKQWGEWAPGQWSLTLDDDLVFFPGDETMAPHSATAGPDDPREHWWTDDGLPEGLGAYRVGKARAGRLLDGVEHNGMPEVTGCL